MVTIAEVAQDAGVSISTVSYALSGKRPISPETRERIEESVRRLGYAPRASARALAARRSGILAVTAPLHADTDPSAHMLFALQVTVAARSRGYDTLLLVDDDGLEGMARSSATALTDGIVVLDVATDDPRADLARTLAAPSVFIGLPDDPTGLTCVDIDFEACVREAVEKLAAAGHRRVGMIAQHPELFERGSNYATRIERAFEAETARAGLEAAVVRPVTERAEDAVAELFDRLAITALVVSTTTPLAADVPAALAARGLSVPRDLSVIALGLIPVPGRPSPPFDALPLDPALTCPLAVDLLADLIDGGRPRGVVLVKPDYQDLGTVAPAPDRGRQR